MIKAIFVLAVIGFVSGVDYCTNGVCSGRSHIACGNSGDYGSECPSERNMVMMTTELKNAILNSHNTKRNTIASGKQARFESAERMATMQWDDELAKLAELNVKRCVFSHDQCHNTDKFRSSGQNIAKKWWSGGNPSDLNSILGQIDSWYGENKDANMDQIRKYPSKSPSKTIGHFTVMVADRNIAVGCAAIKFPDPKMKNWNSLTLACNYATTNMMNFPLYATGSTASKCTTGRNPSYPGLCSTSEHFDVNKWF